MNSRLVSLRPPDFPESLVLADVKAHCQRYIEMIASKADWTPVTAFVCGSYSRDEAASGSDLDLYVIVETLLHSLRIQNVFEGMAMQTLVMTEGGAMALLESGWREANPFYVDGFSEARFIGGDEAVFAQIVARATRLSRAGPRRSSLVEMERERTATMSVYMKALKSIDTQDFLPCAYELLNQYLRFRQRWLGGWVYQRRWIVRKGSIPAKELTQLFDALARGNGGDAYSFMERVHEGLVESQALEWSTSRCGALPL